MNKLPDEHLIEAAIKRDDEAFIRLVSKYKHRVMSIAARFSQIREDLDDVCQEVFIKVYQNLRSYKKEVPFEHWLSRITVNTCYDALRKKKRQISGTSSVFSLKYDIADMSNEARQAAADAYHILYRGMSKLKASEQLVITLLELEDRSIREISDLTGWSESKVKVRAFRARKALKKFLEEIDHE
ncbi:MAG TPA: RNA polymerase sigma factor [Deltaproteobacteria bacterium]|nr:RNA polymerase sigma factor [Deltaproteobacteria bacterium]